MLVMRLQGKVAIVTGAAQGIGRAYALRFGQEGAHVVVADVLRDKADDVIRELHRAGHDAMAVAVDASDRDSVLEMVTSCVERFGRVHVLLNNAALVAEAEQKPFEELSREEWDRVLAVNLTGSFRCCQEVAPHMRRRRQGRIINISSAVTRTSGPWAYADLSTGPAAEGDARRSCRRRGVPRLGRQPVHHRPGDQRRWRTQLPLMRTTGRPHGHSHSASGCCPRPTFKGR